MTHERKNDTITIRISSRVREDLEALARKQGMKISTYIYSLLVKHLQEVRK